MDTRVISYQETLLYYDGPQLITARDQLGLDYVCLLRNSSASGDTFICVPVSNGRLKLLTSGMLDLRTVFEDREVEVLYEGTIRDGDLSNFRIIEIESSEVENEWLPGTDLYLEPLETTDLEVIDETVARGRAIIHCRLNPPEAQRESKISAENLSQAVKLYQRVVKYAYQKSLSELTKISDNLREVLIKPENYRLEIFKFSPGSFTLHMQTEAPADMFGYSNVERALKIIDDISNRIEETQDAFEIVAGYGGHFATAYKDLLKFIIDKEMPLSYEWSMPQVKRPISGRIIPRYAKPLYDELVKNVDVGAEEKILVGVFTRLDKSGSWRLRSDEDQKEYSGTSELDLEGTVFLKQHYRLICEERLIEEQGTGRESTRLHLNSYDEI